MSSSSASSSSSSRMIDELRIYRADDPNDAPERRLYPFPVFNPFIPTALPNYVIPPIANSLAAMQMWCLRYSAEFQQQRHQHHLQTQQHLQQRLNSSSTSPVASSPSSSTATTYHHQRPHSQQAHPQQAQVRQDRQDSNTSISSDSEQDKKANSHIKKPLNPFMIYMQKMRPEIVRQGIIKESAAINQMLGQQWRQLSKEQQAPYYDLADQEKKLHAQKYPGWSARDNYANQKKKKKLKLKSISLNGLDQSDKKCRARFGLNNMASWCKPCKRKKKCIYSQPSSKTNNDIDNDNSNHLNHHHTTNHSHNQHQHQQHHHHHYPLQHSITHMIN